MHIQPETIDAETSAAPEGPFRASLRQGLDLSWPLHSSQSHRSARFTTARTAPDRRCLARQRVDFEQLVGELSMRFIDLPAADLDAAIEEAQCRIVEALDLDRARCSTH
jgi:hypothetical protein